MPSLDFFGHLGFFVQRSFFDPPLCAWLQALMTASVREKARITGSGGDEFIDESERRVLFAADLPNSATSLVSGRLRDLKPTLEEHFQISLAGCQSPVFLSYQKGDFYNYHTDSSPNARGGIRARRVSIVIFLNQASKEPAENCYGGGGLAFCGLLKGEPWDKCAFTLDAEPGSLVAFPSDTWHEVKPVCHGQRFTIVTWFVTDERASGVHPDPNGRVITGLKRGARV